MTNKIKTVIIDDKKSVVATLSHILTKYCKNVEIAGTAYNVESGISCINKSKPNLIFTDIEMPDGTGFDLLNRIQSIKAEIVFITAHNEYAIKAFEFSAIHYILKPFNHEDVIKAVQRFEYIHQDRNTEQKIELLNHNLQQEDKRIALPTNECIEVVDVNSIIYCESVKDYLIFYLDNKKEIIITKSISSYEKLLFDFGFFRIHNSYLINMKHIKRYVRGRGGYVSMINGKKLDVSVRRKQAFLIELTQL
jgi:two-component system, LytTR family, response regulator